MKLTDQVVKVRSKNAGPFWVTIDVFCGTDDVFNAVRAVLSAERVAALYKQPVAAMKRFEIADICALKFSLPRPVIQGNLDDRDMHGAQYALLLAELELDD